MREGRESERGSRKNVASLLEKERGRERWIERRERDGGKNVESSFERERGRDR